MQFIMLLVISQKEPNCLHITTDIAKVPLPKQEQIFSGRDL